VLGVTHGNGTDPAAPVEEQRNTPAQIHGEFSHGPRQVIAERRLGGNPAAVEVAESP
jgi:hypothetical protein